MSKETNGELKAFMLESRSMADNQRGISMSEFARRLGVDTGFVSRFERGLVDIPHEKIDEVAEILGCSKFDLMVKAGYLGIDALSEADSRRIKFLIDTDQLLIK